MAAKTPIGIVGTGMLGGAVGLRLLEKGHRLYVYNRTRDKTAAAERGGATVCESPGQVAQNCDLLITVVKDADAVERVAFGEDGIAGAGRRSGNNNGSSGDPVVADMSTISPQESRRISGRYGELGTTMLDTPVMGGPNVAISGGLVMMASGDRDAFDRFGGVFDTVADRVFYLGEKVGTAHAVKLAMNMQIAMLALALSEGIVLTRGAGIDPGVFLRILNSTYFKTGMSENKAFKMIRDEFSPTFTLANLRKDLRAINRTAESFGLDLTMSRAAEEAYAAAAESGFGDLDYTGILAYIKRASGS